MDWDDLRYLLAVKRRGTLAGAAKELKVTKATASRRLAALEEAVGTRLFERRPHGLILTMAGSALVETVREMEDAVASAEARIASSLDVRPSGLVRVTAPQWVAERLFIGELPALKKRYPELDIDFIGTNAILNLAQHEADLAIRNVAPTHRSLFSRRIAELGGCVYASKAYLERRGIPKSEADVASHDVLVYESLGGIPGFEWMRESGRARRIAFRANDAVALMSAAIGEPNLTRVPTLGFSHCDVFLVGHEQTRRAPRIRAVTDFIVDVFRKRRDLIRG